MEEVVAVAVKLDNGDLRYFMTWGRIQDPVDPRAVERLVLEYSQSCDLGGIALRAELCPSLREASGEPFFYEALMSFARMARPAPDRYEDWRQQMARAMEQGREIYFLGRE